MNKNTDPAICIALPLMNENEHLSSLIQSLFDQSCPFRKLFICVNQPDEWWDIPSKRNICEENAATLRYLSSLNDHRICIIDRSGKGRGWAGKKHGVGWARKTAMDEAVREAGDNDILVSLDGDTTFGRDYLASVLEKFREHPGSAGMAIPYFHLPVADPLAYRAILRYEIYMRYYNINLWRIGSPYAFTALGSAMACRVSAYKATGGMIPKMSGEDFYFLQKLRKYGDIICWNREKVYPAARFSDRVYFGTGPAMIKGNGGDWSSYPVYPFRFFDEIKETTDLFPSFFLKTRDTMLTRFLREIFCEEDPFDPLRGNARTLRQFVRSCNEKVDGLRILQYLKRRHLNEPGKDEENLADFINAFYKEESLGLIDGKLSFARTGLEDLEKIRCFLMKKEEEYQISSLLSKPGRRLPEE